MQLKMKSCDCFVISIVRQRDFRKNFPFLFTFAKTHNMADAQQKVVDTTIANNDVVTKYKTAAEISTRM